MLNGIGITWCKMCVLKTTIQVQNSFLTSSPKFFFFFLTSSERELNLGITVSKF